VGEKRVGVDSNRAGGLFHRDNGKTWTGADVDEAGDEGGGGLVWDAEDKGWRECCVRTVTHSKEFVLGYMLTSLCI
jgi:hypothetical protein